MTETYVIVSDDTNHDAHWVHAAHRLLFKILRKRFPSFKSLYFFSDGGPHHFRLALNFYLTVILAADFDVDIMWYFHMAAHGNSIYDPWCCQG